NETKELRQRTVAGQFVARAHQRRHVRRRERLRLGHAAVALDYAIDLRDHGRRTGILVLLPAIENDDRLLLRKGLVAVEHEDQGTGANAIPGPQGVRTGELHAVQHRAILASEVAQHPAVAVALDREVMARETVVFREREFRRAGTAERNPITGQRD